MREILFRGKRIDNGEWVEGNLFIPDIENAKTQICIGTPTIRISYNIIPETVGQYTGLTDKNGKKIFEGDILEYIDTDNEKQYVNIVFKKGAFLIEDHGIVDSDLISNSFCLELEVIGNIHDNPGLLEGE